MVAIILITIVIVIIIIITLIIIITIIIIVTIIIARSSKNHLIVHFGNHRRHEEITRQKLAFPCTMINNVCNKKLTKSMFLKEII